MCSQGNFQWWSKSCKQMPRESKLFPHLSETWPQNASSSSFVFYLIVEHHQHILVIVLIVFRWFIHQCTQLQRASRLRLRKQCPDARYWEMCRLECLLSGIASDGCIPGHTCSSHGHVRSITSCFNRRASCYGQLVHVRLYSDRRQTAPEFERSALFWPASECNCSAHMIPNKPKRGVKRSRFWKSWSKQAYKWGDEPLKAFK